MYIWHIHMPLAKRVRVVSAIVLIQAAAFVAPFAIFLLEARLFQDSNPSFAIYTAVYGALLVLFASLDMWVVEQQTPRMRAFTLIKAVFPGATLIGVISTILT